MNLALALPTRVPLAAVPPTALPLTSVSRPTPRTILPRAAWLIESSKSGGSGGVGGFGPATGLPEGLTSQDAARVAELLVARRAASTRTTYASAWRRFERWCTARGIAAMPTNPETVCAYLAEFATEGVVSGTIEVACAAIAAAHQEADHSNPVADDMVKAVRRGIRRSLGTAPRRQSRPLSTDEIRVMVAGIDRATVKGTRDAALILLGFASALRRSELAGLDLEDLEHQPGGLLIHVRSSKGDPEKRGQVVAVAHGQRHDTDSVTALAAWLDLRGRHAGPLFTGVPNGRVTSRPFTGSGLAAMLKTRAAAVGIPADRVSGHSLRAGHATTAAMAGVDLARIAAQTRHTRISTLVEHYIRPLDAMRVTTSRDLGL